GEGGRADALGEGADAGSRERALVGEHDAACRRERAELAKRRDRSLERGVVTDLRLDEERDQDRADAELGGPGDCDANLLGGRRRDVSGGGGYAAEVVLVEHEGRELEPCRRLCGAERGRRAGVAKVPSQ